MAYIMLDPGHGGNDPGASGQGLVEKERNLAVAQRVKYHLARHGHKVSMTREGDTNPTLSQRTNDANAKKVDALVSIHCNAHTGSAKGVETFCYKFKYRKLADSIQNAVITAKLYNANRGVKEGNLHMVRESNMSAALIEMAFIDNASDAALLKKTEEFAVAISKGILAYFGTSWKNESAPSPAPSTSFKVGDKVVVSKSATNYATGQSMASFVKGSTYTIQELGKDRALLSSINSWVYLKDLSKTSGGTTTPSFNPYTVKVTADSLNVRTGPGTNYSVATTIKKGEVYTIVDEKSGWGKLKSGAGWISLQYTVKH